jgi:uncharacterized protein (TIGR03437 family)
MKHRQRVFWGKTAAIVGAIPILLYAHSAGPDPGYSGVPGEGNCTSCHTGTLNPGGGSAAVSFTGGTTYTPGVSQHLVVTVTDATAKRWGFQLTARTAGNVQAGTFTPGADGYTQVMCATAALDQVPAPTSGPCPATAPLQYIEHTARGTRPGQTGSAAFGFDWTPPTAGGAVTIYVAGNGSNNSTNELGDHIYTASYSLAPALSTGPTPVIASGEVKNGAGFQNSIAAGSWVQIKGTGLSTTSAGRTWTSSEVVNGKLPTSLDGTSVTINGKAAYVYYISPVQVNVLAPVDSNTGPVDVVVTNNGQASAAASVNLAAFSPAFFQYGGANAIATRNGDYALIGSGTGTVPAKPGDVLILWGTGFGPTSPAIVDGQVVTGAPAVTTNPTVTIGGAAATVIATVLSPGSAGLYQVAVTVPNVADGDQEVLATVGGVTSPSKVTIYVKQ